MAIENNRGQARPVDPAVAAARAVVGLYGDPSVTWSILLEYTLSRPVERTQLEAAARDLVAGHPHLGRAPQIDTFDANRYDDVLHRFANTHYGDDEPLLRIALSDSGDRVLLAAHHGAVDGLGLVAAMNSLLGVRLVSGARGISDRPATRGFTSSSVRRLWDALTRPPARFRRAGGVSSRDPRDWLLVSEVVWRTPGTGGLMLAVREAWEQWNGTSPGRRPVVVALGASRRNEGEELTPDRDTAYARVDVTALHTREQADRMLSAVVPEPDFPASRGLGVGPVATRLLRSRLGSTVLVSNLGRLSGDGLVAGASFWPTASGPSGVAVGLVTVGDRTTATVRARRGDFDLASASRLRDLVRSRLEAQ